MNLYAPGAMNIPSPNHSPRNGADVYALVIHIMAGTLPACDSWFANPASQASAHFGIGKDGTIHQYVSAADAAWANGITTDSVPADHGHAKPFIDGLNGANPNRYSLSIEHEGQSGDEMTPAQFASSVKIAAWAFGPMGALDAVPVDREHIIRHSEIGSHPLCPGFSEDTFTRYIAAVKAALGRGVASATPIATQVSGGNMAAVTKVVNADAIEAIKEAVHGVGQQDGEYVSEDSGPTTLEVAVPAGYKFIGAMVKDV